MDPIDTALTSAVRVRELVLETLAERDRLHHDSIRLSEKPLLRSGRVCGVHFALCGPRDTLLTAIWDAETATLWCYDSRGVRFARAEIGSPTC